MLCLIIGILLVTIAVIDIKTMIIPNIFILALIPFSLLSMIFFPQIGFIGRVIGFACVSIPMLLLTIVIPDCFGGGDIKLIAVCGFMLGWQNTLLAAFIAVMLGCATATFLLVCKKNKGEHIPFAPCICAGVFIAMLYGEEIVSWYIA